SRYQAAVSAISGQGGWPLTAFLTPDGRPFFGGTYFPPDDRYGRPGFPRVLASMAEAYQHRRDEVAESAGSVMLAIEHNESFSGREGELGEPLLNNILESILQQFDARNGGFGSQPKFPHPAALDLLIEASTRPGPQAAQAGDVAALTLLKMAAGGMHDQLAGGFHRYSVDERWIVPHFEKMAYDNSELLKTYAHAFQSFVDPRFARVAASTMRWMDEWLSDRELGGFYASQDADESLEDDGDYFTWTRSEAEAVLNPQEFEIAAAFFNLRAVGDMHHNPAKNVLHIVADISALAQRAGVSDDQARALLHAAKDKLYAARLARVTPFVDRTIYTGWNGLCISAYLAAGRALALPEAVAFAVKSLDRVLSTAWNPEMGLSRVVAYGEQGGDTKPVAGVLEDYAFLANAALDAWEATGELRYYTAAEQLAEFLLSRFFDTEGGGFFDTEQGSSLESRIGALGTRRKPLQDAPTPAGNPVTATLLLRLHALSNKDSHRASALDTLQTFAGLVEHLGLYAASFAQALRRAVSPPIQICIIGDDALAEELAAVATARFLLNKAVIRLRKNQLESLPPALADTLPHLPGIGEGSVAVVCKGFVCLPPVRDPEQLLELLGQQL
ncbi:MAG: thioredoxin domain-containing protein, partial [Janthinobacterium lividum]